MERLQAALSVTWYVDFTFKISYGFMEQAQACKESTTVSAQIFMKFINVQDLFHQFHPKKKKNVDSMDRN
jgi:hypothetical protein